MLWLLLALPLSISSQSGSPLTLFADFSSLLIDKARCSSNSCKIQLLMAEPLTKTTWAWALLIDNADFVQNRDASPYYVGAITKEDVSGRSFDSFVYSKDLKAVSRLLGVTIDPDRAFKGPSLSVDFASIYECKKKRDGDFSGFDVNVSENAQVLSQMLRELSDKIQGKFKEANSAQDLSVQANQKVLNLDSLPLEKIDFLPKANADSGQRSSVGSAAGTPAPAAMPPAVFAAPTFVAESQVAAPKAVASPVKWASVAPGSSDYAPLKPVASDSTPFSGFSFGQQPMARSNIENLDLDMNSGKAKQLKFKSSDIKNLDHFSIEPPAQFQKSKEPMTYKLPPPTFNFGQSDVSKLKVPAISDLE